MTITDGTHQTDLTIPYDKSLHYKLKQDAMLEIYNILQHHNKYLYVESLYKRAMERGIVTIKKEQPTAVGRMKAPQNFKEYKFKEFTIRTDKIPDRYFRTRIKCVFDLFLFP